MRRLLSRRAPAVLAQAALAAAVALVGSAPRAWAQPEPDYEALLAERAPAIVTVKYVMKTSDWETTRDVLGAMVEPTGLLVTSSASMSWGEARVASVKVTIGSDPTEHETILVARDTNLGLAYLQLLAPPAGRPLAHVDLSKGVTPKVGQSLFAVSRHGAGFDYAPSLHRLYLTSRIETPRPMWNYAGGFGGEGLPVFDLEGRPVGLVAQQHGSEGAEDQGTDTFVLPLADVRRSIDQAKKRVDEAVAKAKEARDSAKDDASREGAAKVPVPPKEPPTPAAPVPPAMN
jgi:hypothetical protein